MILDLSARDVNYIESCIRLKLYHMHDLAKEMKIEYFDLRDTMHSLMSDEYIYFTKGFTGAMSRAKKRSCNLENKLSNEELLQILKLMIARRYSIYDLSNLRQFEIYELIERSRRLVRMIDLSQIKIDFDDSIDKSLTFDDLMRYKSEEEFQRSQMIRQWEVDQSLRVILKNDEVEVRRVLNNIWNNKNYSDKKLESIANRVIRNSMIDLTKSSITSLHSNSSKDDKILSLAKDLYSIEEIAKIKNLETKEVKRCLEEEKFNRRRISKADSLKLIELHIDRAKSHNDLNELESFVKEGRLTLEEVCRFCKIPKICSSRLTSLDFISKDAVSKGSSIRAARIGKSNVSNASALKNVENDDIMKMILQKELSSEFYSERLYQISQLRHVGNRKFNLERLFRRFLDLTGSCDEYHSSKILRSLQIDMTLNDAICFKNRGILDVSDLKISSYEMKIKRLLDELDVEYRMFDRSIFKYDYEIDFLIESCKIGIEVSPISSHHSNLSTSRYFGAKLKDYHYKKYLEAKRLGYELITLYEYDLEDANFDQFTRPLIISKLAQSKVISARKTRFKEISTKEAREFLESYHRDGYRAASKKFSLVDDFDQIVAVATVSKILNGKYRLERLAYRKDEKIIGGTSKLIKNIFKSIDDLQVLETFSDNDKGDGSSYEKSGFTFVSETGPRLIYISNSDPNDRYNWQISGPFDHSSGRTVVGASMLKDRLDASHLTDEEIERYIEEKLIHRTDDRRGYDRLYTSGSKKWKIERNEVL